jgi:hypothetical protein
MQGMHYLLHNTARVLTASHWLRHVHVNVAAVLARHKPCGTFLTSTMFALFDVAARQSVAPAGSAGTPACYEAWCLGLA